MENVSIILTQKLHADKKQIDPRKEVGVGKTFTSISHLLEYQDILTNGLLVEDTDNSVTWQIYFNPGAVSVSVTGMYEARLYDGTFYVRACDAATPITLTDYYFEGEKTVDSVDLVEDDKVLVVNNYPQLHGVWIVKNGRWVRHPIFDQSIDNLIGIRFIVEEGHYYQNSQWEYTTRGEITPATLVQNASLLAGDDTDIAEFNSYSYLNFELIGGRYEIFGSFTSPLETVTINRFRFISKVNSPSYDYPLVQYDFIAMRPYTLIKTDSGTNYVSLAVGEFKTEPSWVLIEQSDWVEYILKEDKSNSFTFKSNRVNKIVLVSSSGVNPIDRNCKIDFSLPLGYRLFSITGRVYSATDNLTVSLGTTSLGNDLSADAEYKMDETPTTTIVNLNTVSDIYVSSSNWYGGYLVFQVLIVKEG